MMRQRRHRTGVILAAGLLLAGAAWWLIPSPRGPSYTAVDLKAMGDFGFDPATGTLGDVPRFFRQLNGREVVIEGEPYQPDPLANPHDGDDLHFQLVYSLDYWGSPGGVQKRIFAHMPSAQLPNDFGRRRWIAAYGTLHVRPVADPYSGSITELYSLDVDRLENTDGSLTSSAGPSAWDLASAWQRGTSLAAIAAVILSVGGLWYYRLRDPRSRERGADPCPVCGYDARVRTTPQCPECGALLDSVSCRQY